MCHVSILAVAIWFDALASNSHNRKMISPNPRDDGLGIVQDR
jgi:hypothetical protein